VRHATVALLLALCLALAACGDDDSDDSGSADSERTTTREDGVTDEKAEKETGEIHGLSDLYDCLEGVGYQLDRYDKNGIRVNGGDGAPVADIDIHPSEKAAKRFYAQLVVEGAQGGRFTVTYNMGGTDETERAVIADCVEQAG
jgi:hypothetical protein